MNPALAIAPESTRALVVGDRPTADWGPVVEAWLDACERRTGSARTSRTYGSAVRRFAVGIGDLGRATPAAVHLFAYGSGPSGRVPAASTVIVRLAALQSLYRFATRAGVWQGPNPAADVDRPRQAQPVPRGLDAAGVLRLLAAVPSTPAGQRDRALVIVMVLTGLRRSEALGLRARDINTEGGLVTWSARVKGGQVRRRELPAPAWHAIDGYLEKVGRPFDGLDPESLLFPVTGNGFAHNLARYARRAGLGHLTPHALRHTAARVRRATGASIEDIQALLGHRSVTTTGRYLARLEPESDSGWAAVAAALRLS